MYVIWVSPLSSRVRMHLLTYYTAEDVSVGSILNVPVRTSETPALVLHRESVADVKTFLRRAGFSARRVAHAEPTQLVSQNMLRAFQHTADFYACSVGSVVRASIPAPVLSHTHETKHNPICIAKNHEKRALQLAYTERMEAYKTIIRETFALKQSVVLMAPTAHEAQQLYTALKNGIQTKIHLLSNANTPTQQRTQWHNALTQDGPLLICTTPTALALPRCDIGLYIVEHASSQAYKRRQAPYLDMRTLAESLAEHSGAHILFADTFLPLTYHEQLLQGRITEYETIPKRMSGTNNIQSVDMKTLLTKLKEHTPSAQFPVLAPEVVTALSESLAKQKKVFILATRRGFAGTTTCDDCGTTVVCKRCNHPVALHTKKNERVFLCHRCGESRSAKERCAQCTGWRLTPLGRGVERVESALKKEFKKAPLFRIDTDTTPKAIAQSIQQWNARGGIIVGTERALSYIHDAYISVCASLDTLLSIPDFKIDERVFSLLMRLHESTNRTVYVQTQQPHAPVLVHAMSGNVGLFVRNELALRESLHYPPYTVIIKFTCIGTKTTVTKNMQTFAITLARHKPRIFGTFIHRGKYVELSALLRVKRDAWPKKDIVDYARALPPCWRIDVLPNRSDS